MPEAKKEPLKTAPKAAAANPSLAAAVPVKKTEPAAAPVVAKSATAKKTAPPAKADPKVTASVAKKTAVAETKPVAKPVAKAAKTAPASKTEKAPKQRKVKLVRDSFTMPDSEYELLASLKKRCLASGFAAKKSELLRAAVIKFAALKDEEVVAELKRLEVIKTGRPAKNPK